ncbi:hypothetical protein RMATCC62417_16191 [Rhizopus microsporus]|nr:hypothetical protein RMATCC62417_16191 [Rhizopus microsporus]
MSEIKELLLSAFKQEEYKDISLEAKFGHLLCRNSIKAQMTPNLLQPISTSDINISSLQELIKSNQTTFFNAMPPAKLASDFIPFTSDGGVHQKLIKAEYVNNELLMNVDNNDQPKDNNVLNRLQVEFIVQENGSMKFNRAIGEKKRSVIDVLGLTSDIDSRYLIEGQPSAVENAKRDIQGHLKLVEGQVQVPIETLEGSRFRSEISRVLADISKVSGSYISLDNNKFVFTSLSDHAMENAKRLLNLTLTELNMTSKKPLEQANKTLVNQGSEFNLVPFHDSLAMPMYDRQFGWSRLKKKNDSEHKEPNLINLADQQ